MKYIREYKTDRAALEKRISSFVDFQEWYARTIARSELSVAEKRKAQEGSFKIATIEEYIKDFASRNYPNLTIIVDLLWHQELYITYWFGDEEYQCMPHFPRKFVLEIYENFTVTFFDDYLHTKFIECIEMLKNGLEEYIKGLNPKSRKKSSNNRN